MRDKRIPFAAPSCKVVWRGGKAPPRFFVNKLKKLKRARVLRFAKLNKDEGLSVVEVGESTIVLVGENTILQCAKVRYSGVRKYDIGG